MVVKDYAPLNVVCGEGFSDLIHTIAPTYSIPCRNTVRARIMSRYEGEKDLLRTDLAAASGVALTTDTWTSNNTVSYITVTEHHIQDSERNMHSSVLMTRDIHEKHMGTMLRTGLQSAYLSLVSIGN